MRQTTTGRMIFIVRTCVTHELLITYSYYQRSVLHLSPRLITVIEVQQLILLKEK